MRISLIVLFTFISIVTLAQKSDPKTDSIFNKLESEGFPPPQIKNNKPLIIIIEGNSTVTLNTSKTVNSKKEIEYDKISGIDPDTIESINILKGKQATDLYGKKGECGVVIITLKKGIKFSGI